MRPTLDLHTIAITGMIRAQHEGVVSHMAMCRIVLALAITVVLNGCDTRATAIDSTTENASVVR